LWRVSARRREASSERPIAGEERDGLRPGSPDSNAVRELATARPSSFAPTPHLVGPNNREGRRAMASSIPADDLVLVGLQEGGVAAGDHADSRVRLAIRSRCRRAGGVAGVCRRDQHKELGVRQGISTARPPWRPCFFSRAGEAGAKTSSEESDGISSVSAARPRVSPRIGFGEVRSTPRGGTLPAATPGIR